MAITIEFGKEDERLSCRMSPFDPHLRTSCALTFRRPGWLMPSRGSSTMNRGPLGLLLEYEMLETRAEGMEALSWSWRVGAPAA